MKGSHFTLFKFGSKIYNLHIIYNHINVDQLWKKIFFLSLLKDS